MASSEMALSQLAYLRLPTVVNDFRQPVKTSATPPLFAIATPLGPGQRFIPAFTPIYIVDKISCPMVSIFYYR
jgi:hypothetical protein